MMPATHASTMLEASQSEDEEEEAADTVEVCAAAKPAEARTATATVKRIVADGVGEGCWKRRERDRGMSYMVFVVC